MLFRRMRKGDATWFDALMIRFSSIWQKKISGLSWSRAPLPASDWLVPPIWPAVAFVSTALRGEQRGPPRATVTMLNADVTDDRSVEQAVATVLDREGRLDIVVNNAGMGIAGPVENTSIEQAKRQLEVNFFGAFRVCRAVLPAMRSQRSGYIVNIGSIGGLVAIPYQAMYSASKFALEGLSEALRMEVRSFGIRVVIIEPGDHKTALTENRQVTEMSGGADAYSPSFEAALARDSARRAKRSWPGADCAPALSDRKPAQSPAALHHRTRTRSAQPSG